MVYCLLEFLKKRVCEICFKLFRDNIVDSRVIGLGTGSTIKYFIDLLFSSKLHVGREIVVSSIDTQQYILMKHGVLTKTVLDLNDNVDIYIDGFDEASTNLDLIKGRGGAFYWEKLLASRSSLRIYIGDYTKWNGREYLYMKPIPIEVEKEYLYRVLDTLISRNIKAKIRMNKSREGPVVTDSGNYIIDVYSYKVVKPVETDNWFKNIKGVVETGIFPNQLVDYVLIAGPGENLFKLYARR
uniref:Ribose 5-phosphate isomerase A n=1 Tax=Staphylothermus marinus TaxID=2280 RepID=A0A7C4D746_STAMA